MLKLIWKIIKSFVTIIIFLFVAIVLLQRITNNEKTIAGIRIFTVVTESMMPEYQVGDVLLVQDKPKSEIQVGDDVAYLGEVESYAGKVITHRVVKIEEDNGKLAFHTKGIANLDEDPLVKQDQIYGTVTTKLKMMSWLNGIINNTYGMYFLIVIPLAVIVFSEMKAFKEEKLEVEEEYRKKNSEKEEREDEIEEEQEEEYDHRDRSSRRKARRAKRRRKYDR